jgi:autotransporter-associated beta strand protein
LHTTQDAKPKRPGSRASGLGRAALLGGVWFCALAPGIANAVDGIWTGAGTEWTTGTNWSSAPTVPDNTATFINNGAPTSVTISNDASINTIQFNAAAPAYSITVNAATFAISGGIVNGGTATIVNNPRGVTGFLNSSSADHTTIVNDGVFSPIALGGTVFFLDSSTASSATIFNRHDGFTGFAQTSTAANVTITNSDNGPLSFLSGGTYFFDASNAGSATIVNNSGGIAYFGNISTAANGTINNNNGGTTYFVESSTAGTATIVNNSGGSARFSNISTAANATIINNGGATYFFDSSTAGTATIITNSGGVTQFNNASTSGQARFSTNAGGTVDISPLRPGEATAGSIEGAGSYMLGSKQFTVGSNNLSTVVSGVIADGGQAGGTGGSLVKVGTGTLVLSGSNLYTGGTRSAPARCNSAPAAAAGRLWATWSITALSPSTGPTPIPSTV